MNKETALNIIINSFKIYKQEFVNKNVLFVFREKTGSIKGFETTYEEGNFKHLTGVESQHGGENFYTLLDRNQLSTDDFSMNPDGTTVKKLFVLHMLKDIIYSPYTIGYARQHLLKNNSLKIDIATGNSKKLTIGYRYSSHPITLLNMNPGDAVIDKYTVLFTLIKENNEAKYKKVSYWKEGTSKNTLKKIESPFKNQIDFSSIK